ncbi:MAG: chitobiase/beta-hexosaminidase C-terminal domain-containing protein [Lachnospiraceae bacterium]|nr:chitobiase/beta-hexosaminidase C-terminal domain-containing protein [Lachnospiraceae bacterium]
MICPNCNAEIADDLLYCPKCGEEVQYVPYYEPEIEQSISDTLSDIQLDAEASYEDSRALDTEEELEFVDLDAPAGNEMPFDYGEDAEYYDRDPAEYSEEIEYQAEGYDESEEYQSAEYDETEEYAGEYGNEYDDEYEVVEEFDEEYELDYLDDFDEEDPHIMYHFLKFMKESRLRWIVIAFFLVVVVSVVVGIVRVSQYMYQNNSSSYQAELAASFAAEGNYTDAIAHMERSVMLSSEDTSLKYQLAEYYFKNAEEEKGVLMLWEIIYAKDVNYQAAYRRMIDYYASRQDYAMIEEILSNCEDMIIVNQFQNYMANEPQFSSQGGTYDEIVYLKLSSNSEGTIYYTMDGTMPTYESPVYKEPLILERGIYKINAIFVNSYGIESDVVSMTYTIDIRVPNPPNVILEGGNYTIPELITVDVQTYCTVYYTTDGTIPTNTSTEYTGPVPMPLGTSHFTFIAYSQEGIPGEVTEVDYNLSLQGSAQVQDITANLMQYNVNLGKASDLTGYVAGNTMRYSYIVSSAICLEDKIYYIFVENMVSNSPNMEQGTTEQSMRTGTFYLADINDGSLYKGERSEEGVYSRGDLIPPEAYAPPVVVVSENIIPEM